MLKVKSSRKAFASFGCLGMAAAVAIFSIANNAHAGAFGCEYIGGFGFTFKGVSLKAPQGYLCHKIDGSGKSITNERAAYVPSMGIDGVLRGRVCNFRIDYKYYDTNNKLYRTDRGPTTNSCSYVVSRNVSADKTLTKYGKACAVLYVGGVERSRQCHNIIK